MDDAHDLLSPDLAAVLDDEERETVHRYVFETDRSRFVFRRALLRHLLADYVGQDPAALRFGRNAWGKPHLCSPLPGKGLEFNLSSSKGMVLVAVSTAGHVGVDLEATDASADHELVARQHFPPAECEFLNRLPDEGRDSFFFARWTCMEATLKAVGTGFMPVAPGLPPEAGDQRDPSSRPIPLCFQAAPGFIGALAWRAGPVRLQWFSLDTARLFAKSSSHPRN